MKRTVAYIIGTSYSGSSLLNLLLDSFQGVRGLGEAVHLLDPQATAHCGRCRRPVPHCPLHAAVRREAFYQSLFDFYDGSDVLVDSSKGVATSLRGHPFERQFEHRILLLSKTPHEFAFSWRGHHPEATVTTAFRIYLDFYEGQLAQLEREAWLRPWHLLPVTYRELATRTDWKLSQIGDFLGLSLRSRGQPFASDTHIVGGNWMVAAQTGSPGNCFTPANRYLNGKYVGKYRTVFYDQQWRQDKEFVKECLQSYEIYENELARLLGKLGQGDFRQLVADLQDHGRSPLQAAVLAAQ